MDMLTVDLTHLPNADVGSAVELWGPRRSSGGRRQRRESQSYELLCSVKRAPLVHEERRTGHRRAHADDGNSLSDGSKMPGRKSRSSTRRQGRPCRASHFRGRPLQQHHAGAPRRMSWLGFFLIAGLFEIGWAIGLKYTDGFTRLWPSVGTVAAMIVSITLLGWAMRSLPVGTAYAVWTGIGAVGTVLLGIVLFGEAMTMARLACVALIVTGILGLKLAS